LRSKRDLELAQFEAARAKTEVERALAAVEIARRDEIVAGLDQDFRGEPFGSMPELLSLAEYVDKLHAICMVCGKPATRTQRLIHGKPADYNDPIILIGARERYEARCRLHHEVTNKPSKTG